jgi:hypothetical protein
MLLEMIKSARKALIGASNSLRDGLTFTTTQHNPIYQNPILQNQEIQLIPGKQLLSS